MMNGDSVKLFPTLKSKPSSGSAGASRSRRGDKKVRKSKELDPVFREIFPGVLSTRPPPTTSIVGETEPHIFLGFNASHVVLDGPGTESKAVVINADERRLLVPEATMTVVAPFDYLGSVAEAQMEFPASPERLYKQTYDDIPMPVEDALSPAARKALTPAESHVQSEGEERTYSTMMDQYSLHNFILWNGEAQMNTPEFQSFQRTYASQWDVVSAVLRGVEDFVKRRKFKLVIIRGGRLIKVGLKGKIHDDHALASCIEMVRDPGTTFVPHPKDDDDRVECAMHGQRFYRGWKGRQRVALLRLQTAAAIIIQAQARRFIQVRYRLDPLLASMKEKRDIFFGRNLLRLKEIWRTPSSSSTSPMRLMVVLPSLSLPEIVRIGMGDFQALQNALVPYLHHLSDPDVHMVFITPTQIGKFELTYHERMLALMGISLSTKRLHFLTPEFGRVMPSHTPLAQTTWFSTGLLRELRRKITRFGSRAMLVTNIDSWAERRVAYYLGLSILGCDTSIASRLAAPPCARRLFKDASVNIPMGSREIFSKEEIVLTLTTLVSTFMDTDVWVLRLNNATSDKGELAARFDVKKLPGLHELRRRVRTGTVNTEKKELTNFREFQMDIMKQVLVMIRQGLGKCTALVDQANYPNWSVLTTVLKAYGGVIEALPPAACKPRALYALLFIDPFGEVVVEKGLEGVAGDSGVEHAVVYPQEAVADAALDGASRAVAQTLWEQYRVVGYVTVKFVAFSRDPGSSSSNNKNNNKNNLHNKDNMLLWAQGITLGCTGHHATVGALKKLTTPGHSVSDTFIPGKPATADGIPNPPAQKCYVHIPLTFSPHLVGVRDDVFFKMCGMHGVTYDTTFHNGVLFFLGESVVGGNLNMMAVADSVGKACETISEALSFITKTFHNVNAAGDTSPLSLSSVQLTIKKAIRKFSTKLETPIE